MKTNALPENEQRSRSRRTARARSAGGPPRRVTLLLSLAVFLFIVSIPAYGYYDVYIAPLREPMVKVNDKVFTMGDYVERLRYLEAENTLFGQKLDYGKDPFVLLDSFRDNELIRQASSRLGLLTTEAELIQALKQRVGALPKEGEQPTDEEIERRFQELYKQRLIQVNLSDSKYRQVVRELLLRDKLKEHLNDRLPAVAEQVRVLGMLLQDEEAAKRLKKQAEAGENFGTLARANSIDTNTKDNLGDMGWIPKDTMPDVFDELVFKLSPNAVSDPFFMNNGYWIIKVLEHAVARQVEGEARTRLQDRALEEWLAEEQKKATTERYFDSERYEFVLNKLKEYRIPSASTPNPNQATQ